MSFLDNYEDVAARIQRFWATHPSGKIHTHIVDVDIMKGYVLVECRVYKEFEDTEPSAIDYAFGNVATYNANMKKWFIEDTVTSAIGRAVGLVLGSDKRPTAQNMAQVEQVDVGIVKDTASDPIDFWATPLAAMTAQVIAHIAEPLSLLRCKHGEMKFNSGKKNDKAWGGWFCDFHTNDKALKCAPQWAELGSDGKWQVQK